MKFTLCNEIFEGRPMADACAVANRLRYDGVEIAPFTLGQSVVRKTPGVKTPSETGG